VSVRPSPAGTVGGRIVPLRAPADAGPGADSAGSLTPPDGGSAVWADCEIVNQRGLHARAAAKFVKTADRFDAAVKVFSRGQEVSGHSIMGLMMLAAGPGTIIRVVCEGAQAQAALDDIRALIAGGFDED
jgi:phosphocarrier protein